MRSLENIHQRVEALRRASADRDERHRNVADVRSGDLEQVMPGNMPDAWPHPIVANLIDTSARDMSEVMGVMPSVNCATGILTTDKAKKFAGAVMYVIEPDFQEKRPHIRVESPRGVYFETDMFGRLKSYSKVWQDDAVNLAAKFPHLIHDLQANETGSRGEPADGWQHRRIEVVKYTDADQIILYLPNHGNAIADHIENPMGEIMVSPGFRPGYDEEVRGAFDDAIWVQLAKARMALLGLEATEKTVRAPLAVPRDVQKMTFGDDAIIRTDQPDKIRRGGIDVPQASYQALGAPLRARERWTQALSPARAFRPSWVASTRLSPPARPY